jgi:23S rRNA pseudouridine2605 synthase
MMNGFAEPSSVHFHSTAMPTRKSANVSSRAPQPIADGPQRLQKLLAAAGLGSRRRCEELILAGRVDVDGRIVTALGTKADRARQQIRVDGVPLPSPKRVYFMVHKPQGVVSTSNDPAGRPRVIDMVPHTERLFTVGRLDLSSEGLILVTNDGELANALAHPRYGVEKVYQVEVAGTMDRKDLAKLGAGVHLAEGVARALSARVKHAYRHSTLLEIVLAEGRNREIRRMLARAGHKVLRLKRVALGPLRLAELPPGAVRPLSRDEVQQLKLAARKVSRRRRVPSARPKPPGKLPAAAPTRSIIGGDPPTGGTPRRRGKAGGPPGRPRSARRTAGSRRS